MLAEWPCSASSAIVQSTTRRTAPTRTQVLVKITHSGICAADEHFKHADMVLLGHEGVGAIGDVTCGACEQCMAGELCPCAYNAACGSFGWNAIWNAADLLHIPEAMAPEAAAPLMCAGASMFSVIENIRPTHRVDVGGLGHLAIQFLAKMGADVVMFSSTDTKRANSIRPRPSRPQYLGVVKPRGTIYPLTANGMDLVFPTMPLIICARTIQGTIVVSRLVHRKMQALA
ncbi:putative NADP-dependent alcohol dehydrogenase C 2 [Mycena rebaudengoi]|nr:putative NADP-dependent alcohol dehydrogenase C 2 [Mycena rebaudengoi]